MTCRESLNNSMLEQTFLHLPGIGALTERRLWEAGVRSWADLEDFYVREPKLFPEFAHSRLKALQASQKALSLGDATFFAEHLPPREHYRIAATFPEQTLFLDIETTGLSTYYDHVTLIGLSRTNRYACFVYGKRDKAWRDLLDGAKCLVTFNGTTFDLKFLAQEFPDLPLPRAHVDLRFLGRRVGLNGGQKEVEEQLGVERPKKIRDVRGVDAALLWYEYKAGSVNAGRRLAEYNHADIEGMKTILDVAIHRLIEYGAAPPMHANGERFSALTSTLEFSQTLKSRGKSYVRIPRFKGRKGPKVNFADLVKLTPINELRVVGIDLTGSHRRPTGWCILDGRCAETRLLSTDNDLIAATVAASPDIVSIDSPLSLPKGRRSVRDSDRGRKKFGITRACERILKRRGINVYPCLIPSMQALTGRGIKLAKKLRSLGVPVIESYPGAAQDIMNIPRKRASLKQLKQGLRLFGIIGDFSKTQVTHDEVDAITSAVVGLFFWSGKFEALGNDEEEFLIIPDLDKDVVEWHSRRVIGVGGPIAAGKTTAARYLERRGYAYGRYSVVLADLLAKEGRSADRTALQEKGDLIHRWPGQRWLNRQLLNLTTENQRLVIDGLRWPEDHAFWVERFGPAFLHLQVHAERETRKRRYILDGHSEKEFENAVTHVVEREVPTLGELADMLIPNNGSILGYKRKISRAIEIHFSRKEVSCQSR